MAEKFFWADQIADEIIEKEKDKKEFVCASGITPSGTIHIGNFREVITTDLVVRALRDKGKKVRFIYSWDDYDRFRKVPKNIPEEYEKYIGLPLSEIPSPFESKCSYAEHFKKPFESSIKKVGIEPDFINQNEMNKKCKYDDLIKTALDKRKEIIKILDKYRKEPLKEDWHPLNVYCEKCGKDFTKVTGHKEYKIDYSCKCGYAGELDYSKKGLVKLKWRVDWPSRWEYEGVDFEPGGMDHSAAGGSFDTAKEIAKKVFNGKIPTYTFYEWINVKGIRLRDFHSSKGNVVTLDEVEEVYEPEVLRYIFVGTRPNKAFQISFDNEIIKIYDEYDDLENRYFEKLVNEQEKRIYELSQIKIPKKKPNKESFRHLITLVQTDKIEDLNPESKRRAKKVKKWLEKYADEDMGFELQKEINIELSNPQKKALEMLKESLSIKEFTEEDLFNEFYTICEGADIKPKDFFQTAYRVIIGKSKGPRLAGLILAIGQKEVVNLLEKMKS